ncbi:MAG: response regulator [Thermodesulfobacteriota bacterium]
MGQGNWIDKFTELISASEDWLIRRMHYYVTSRGYDKYSSTLEEAWRLSISVLSTLLVRDAAETGGAPAEFSPEDDFQNDPVASFGIMEAQRHRERGVDMGMFLSLLKYYRQAYIDLVSDQEFSKESETTLNLLIIRFFDRIEIGISLEWSGKENEQLLEELRSTNRFLTNEKNKYLTLVESLSDPVLLLDLNNRIDNINQAAAVLLGRSGFPGSEYYCLSRDRVLEFSEYKDTPHPPAECLNNESLETLLPWLGPAFSTFRESGRSETRLEMGTEIAGRPRWFDVVLTPMPDISGKFGGATLVLRDITERKKSEAEREKLQEELLQSQKMESIGRLAGGVAHDFNNMLGVIIGHSELALEQIPLNDAVQEDLQEILSAARRSADLTRQLLAFARKQTISPIVLDLNETVEGMLKMLRRLIGEDIHLIWLPQGGLWPTLIDPAQIDQILANLCVNARDAIDGIGKITIETGNVTLDESYCGNHAGFIPGDFVLLAVSDSGCGMEKETLGKLFEPFFTTKEVGTGTGLGLATIYGIVKQNYGFINAYSEPDQGTTFKIYLPRHTGKIDRGAAENGPNANRGGPETILLVEDEPSILNLAKKVLERLGYRVLAAPTPGEAIRIAENFSEEIHLLMTDVIMPEMNGLDLADRLESCYPDLKRLFMSGYTANVIAHHGVLEKGIDFIQKPFSRSEVAAKVREVLDRT